MCRPSARPDKSQQPAPPSQVTTSSRDMEDASADRPQGESGSQQPYDPTKDPKRKAKSNDPAWNYCYWPDLNKKDVVKCILCGKIVHSGVRRLKQHLVGSHGDVAKCPKTTSAISKEMSDYLKKNARQKPIELDDDKEGEKTMKLKYLEKGKVEHLIQLFSPVPEQPKREGSQRKQAKTINTCRSLLSQLHPCFAKHLRMWFMRGIARATLKLHCSERARRRRKEQICMLLILFMSESTVREGDDLAWAHVDDAIGASSSLQGRNFPRRARYESVYSRRCQAAATQEERVMEEEEQGNEGNEQDDEEYMPNDDEEVDDFGESPHNSPT
jgi:hypothetical protein